MASTRQLKGRIRSVKSTKQITKAMQMVAASKMRRAQDATKASTPYSRVANEILTHLANQGATKDHPLFTERQVRNRLYIVVTSDKGLAGAYNANVLKAYLSELRRDEAQNHNSHTIAVGRKASQFVARLKGASLLGSYDNLSDQPSGSEISAIITQAYDAFVSGRVDAIDLIYTEFVSSMTQTPRMHRILPAGWTPTEVRQSLQDAVYEPSSEVVLESVVRRLVEAQLYQALLDARASEHSMRMLAMKNATDNASELVDDLTLEMNKARQAAITQELAEISGGAEAMKG
ncbi:ATP synthase F1 subunit gamma [Candidatus Saccharibacteria bacterium]|nr:MAG: ATP synthase F1 subunit gamma [Candidatus Saccharibacteria bacterium]